jgi:hypothetical protein
VDSAPQFGVVRPLYGPIRRALFPIYASDQLIFFAIAALPFIWLASVDQRLALYTGVGAYVGAMLTMQRSTPSTLLLDPRDETRVIEFLDNSRLLKRTGNDLEWISTLGRLKRWSTDKIRLRRTATGILVTGRLLDLQILAHRIES